MIDKIPVVILVRVSTGRQEKDRQVFELMELEALQFVNLPTLIRVRTAEGLAAKQKAPDAVLAPAPAP